MADMTQVRLIEATPDVVFGACGDVFTVVWRKDTTMGGVAKLTDHFKVFKAEHPEGVWLVTIIEEKASLPGTAERQAVASWMTSVAGSIKISSVVFEGAGFRAAAVRSVVTGLTMLARQPFPHQVFSTVQDAVTWHFSKLGERHTPERSPAALSAAIARLRAMAA